MRCHLPVFTALRMLRQMDRKFKTSLSYTDSSKLVWVMRLYLKHKKQAGEMAEWAEAPDAKLDDLSSIPEPTWGRERSKLSSDTQPHLIHTQ